MITNGNQTFGGRLQEYADIEVFYYCTSEIYKILLANVTSIKSDTDILITKKVRHREVKQLT